MVHYAYVQLRSLVGVLLMLNIAIKGAWSTIYQDLRVVSLIFWAHDTYDGFPVVICHT